MPLPILFLFIVAQSLHRFHHIPTLFQSRAQLLPLILFLFFLILFIQQPHLFPDPIPVLLLAVCFLLVHQVVGSSGMWIHPWRLQR